MQSAIFEPTQPQRNKLASDATPNAAMVAPDTLFTHTSARLSTLDRNIPTTPLSMSHQAAEPKNTPSTSSADEP